MDKGRIDLDLLIPLDALLDTVNVTRAADRICLSQPAMSRILSRLREAFGDDLLVRDGARLQLTPRAEALREPVKQLLRDARDIYSPQIFHPATSDRHFRAAIPDVVAAVILPGLLERLGKEAPHCRLTIIPWPDRGNSARDLDFAIATNPEIFPGYRMERLYQDRDMLAYRSSAGSPPSTAMLSQPHVAVVAAGYSEDLADRWLKDLGLSRSVAIAVPHYLQALHLVARSDLLAILPARLIAALGPKLGVAGAELPIEQTPDQQWLFHPPHLGNDPGLKWISGLLRDLVADSR